MNFTNKQIKDIYDWSKSMDYQELRDKVKEVVIDKCNLNIPFTAYDITIALRNKEGGHVANHKDINHIVVGLYETGEMTNINNHPFSRQLILLEEKGKEFNSFVYFNDNLGNGDPYSHPLAKYKTVQIPVVDNTNDNILIKNILIVDCICTITKEYRLNIPKEILSHATQDNCGNYYIYIEGMGALRKSPNDDGRVRLTLKRFNVGDNVLVGCDNSDTISTITISAINK